MFQNQTLILVFQEKTHLLEVFEFADEDRGRYTAQCVGTDVMTSAVIDVAIPANVEVTEDEIIAKANAMIEINVNVTGRPKPEITWSKVCLCASYT